MRIERNFYNKSGEYYGAFHLQLSYHFMEGDLDENNL